MSYQVVRRYEREGMPERVMKRGVSLEEAEAYCAGPEANSSTCTEPGLMALTRQFGPWAETYSESPAEA
jgi:hypothetical protein